jgi:hypothetical protein
MFTDVSEAFLNAARPRFAQYPFIDFKTLDAERDMMKQGWSLRSTDLVCAANVIHATRDLRNTLTRVRRLLVHGGVLILYELTSPSHYMDATVGLTSGWWEFDDYELRPEYALLSPARWGSFLAELGFETPQIFTPEMGSTKHSVVFARATSATARVPRSVEQVVAAGARPPWLLLAAGGSAEDEIARAVAGMLVDLGERAVVCAASGALDWAALLATHSPSNVVLIVGMESEAAATMAVGGAQSIVGCAGAARLWIVACGATSAALAATLAPLDAAMVWGKRAQWGGVLDVGALGPSHAAHVAFTHMWTESVHTSARATAPLGASSTKVSLFVPLHFVRILLTI